MIVVPITQMPMTSSVARAGSWPWGGRVPQAAPAGGARELVSRVDGGLGLAHHLRMVERTTRTLTFEGGSSTSTSTSPTLMTLPIMPAGGDHLVAAAQRLDHRLVILHLLLLRPDHQEVHDDEDQDDRHEAESPPAAPAPPPAA